MPTRKQRRRRDKSFRHEYETVLVDEEGNETPLAELRAREPKKDKPRAAAATGKGGKGRARPVRQVPPPSWQKALRRGGGMGALMLLVSVFFLFKSAPIGARIALGLVYAVAFIPLTYYTDRVAYRAYLRRSGGAPAKKPKP